MSSKRLSRSGIPTKKIPEVTLLFFLLSNHFVQRADAAPLCSSKEYYIAMKSKAA